MSETSNLKIVTPDANSVLVPLHSHFAALASSADQAITNRFQVKHLLYETITSRDEEYNKDGTNAGKPVDATTGKPDLADGDMCTILQNKRQFVWNVDPSSATWMAMAKQFIFGSISERNAMLAEDLYEGDSCYVSDIDQFCYWTGAEWIGEWKAWTPTITGWTSSTVNYARYRQDGKNIYYEIKITGGASAPSSMTISPPIAPNTSIAEADMPCGTGALRMTNLYVLQNIWVTGSLWRPLVMTSNPSQLGNFSSSTPATYATGCVLRITGLYEAA